MEEPVVIEVEEKKDVPVPAEPAKEALVKPSYEMPVRQDMWAGGQSFADAMRMAKVLSTAPMVPQSYRNEPGNCLIAIDMAQRMNVSPMMVMQQLYIVQGNPGWSGQACIALINNCGRFTKLKFEEEQKGDDFSCRAYATEISSGETLYGTTVDKKMAKEMGWLDKNGSYWKKMPMQMARYRSAAYFARAYCPEALMGCYTQDELYDIHEYPKEDVK